MSQFPDQEFTVICLSNNDDIASWKMNQRIADLALGDRLRPRAARTPARAASELPTVELDEADLRDKVGAYRMKGSGFVWRIQLQDGRLRLTDHFHATCALRPLSATRFDPEGPGFSASTQLVFSRAAAGSPWSLTSQWDEPEDAGRRDFEAVEPVDPTPDQLKEYAGRYESDELAATYRLAVRDGRLWLRVNSRRWEALEATVRDEFVHVQEPADAPHHHLPAEREGRRERSFDRLLPGDRGPVHEAMTRLRRCPGPGHGAEARHDGCHRPGRHLARASRFELPGCE